MVLTTGYDAKRRAAVIDRWMELTKVNLDRQPWVNELTPINYAEVEARVAGMFAGLRMSSREIAELTGKEHKHVLRDIATLISNKAIGQSNFGQTPYVDPQNKQTYYEFVLDFKATMVLMTGYDSIRRAAVIDRWMELEEEKAKPIPPPTREEQLAQAVLLSQQVIAEKDERDKVIEEKVWIADKKNATARIRM